MVIIARALRVTLVALWRCAEGAPHRFLVEGRWLCRLARLGANAVDGGR